MISIVCTLILTACYLCSPTRCNDTQSKVIHVDLCIDNNWGGAAAVLLISMFENAKPNTFYHIYIQVPGNFEQQVKVNISTLENKYKNCKIDFIDMGDKFQDMSGRFPGSSYYYVLAAGLLPNVKKLLYLDADMIVRYDLSELYETNIEDYYFAAVRDSIEVVRGFEESGKQLKLLKMPDYRQYTNAGMVLMNLEKIREDKLEDKFLKWMTNEKENLINGKFFGAQDIINPVCHGKILLVPFKFDAMIGFNVFKPYEEVPYAWMYTTRKEWEDARDPTIVHFAGGGKPWVNMDESQFYKEWRNYSEKTDFTMNWAEFQKKDYEMKKRHKFGKKH